MRIVSLLPAATEILCALGLEDEIVGTTHECDYPPSLQKLPRVTRTLIPPDASSLEIDALVRERLKTQAALYSLDMEVLERLRPDLLVTQCGCDSHWLDPLSHLATSTAIWPVLANTFHDLAHELCGGRWLAMGGGGFDPYSVVPRAWTMLFAGMCGMDLPAELPRSFLELRQQHVASLPGPLPGFATTFAETMDLPIPEAHYQYVLDITARTLGRLREAAFPPLGATDTD